MSYIFLSYAKADRDSAFAMRDVLKKEGFRVWMDENQHELSILYWPQIQKNINDSGLFVLLVSDAAQKSAWLKRELNYAESIQKPIRAFVVEGEGWERVNPYLTPLALGLRMDVPQQAANEIKTLLYASKDNLIPLQIPSDTISKSIRMFVIGVCVIGIALIILSRVLPIATTLIENLDDTPVPRTTREVMEATSAASIQTRTYETENAVEIAQTATADARATHQADMNQTAIVRGGVLPCSAQPLEVGELYPSFIFYGSPNPEAISRLERILDTDLILTEWVQSYNITWYRVEDEDGRYYGYIQAEWLVLDEDCPR